MYVRGGHARRAVLAVGLEDAACAWTCGRVDVCACRGGRERRRDVTLTRRLFLLGRTKRGEGKGGSGFGFSIHGNRGTQDTRARTHLMACLSPRQPRQRPDRWHRRRHRHLPPPPPPPSPRLAAASIWRMSTAPLRFPPVSRDDSPTHTFPHSRRLRRQVPPPPPVADGADGSWRSRGCGIHG